MFTVGQRQVSAFIFVLLTIGAAIIGQTPDNLLELITQLMAPLATIGAVFYYLLQAVQRRVSDPHDPFEPGKLLDLFRSAEFVTALVLSVLSLLPMIGIDPDASQKDFIVNIVLNVVSLVLGVPLMRSFAVRSSGVLPNETVEALKAAEADEK